MSGAVEAAVVGAFTPWLAWWGTAATLAVRAALPDGSSRAPTDMSFDVVIPAHNEGVLIGGLLDSLHAQVGPARLGRVLVVADHCSDDTAERAAAGGAEVLERGGGDAGKPASLREGIEQLASRPDRGDAVVLVDGDCRCDPGFLSGLSVAFARGAQVAQAAYTIDDAGETAVRSSLRRAFGLRNVVRAEGGRRLGLPALLVGSGIALRWEVTSALSWSDPRLEGTGDSRPVGDDVLMTLELLGAGVPATFAGQASVVAPAPPQEGDLGAQRLRWEAGQVMMWKLAAGLAPKLAARRDVRSAAALVDWMTPPLTTALAGFAGVGSVAVVLVAAGQASPLVLLVPFAAAGALATYLAVGVSVLEGPRAAAELFTDAPRFVLWKARLYLGHRETRRTSGTVRTAR
jgi:cellulose synthase/poly-beta-1,6-N-acetylglucosamine synthase-like glycosyltransferase